MANPIENGIGSQPDFRSNFHPLTGDLTPVIEHVAGNLLNGPITFIGNHIDRHMNAGVPVPAESIVDEDSSPLARIRSYEISTRRFGETGIPFNGHGLDKPIAELVVST